MKKNNKQKRNKDYLKAASIVVAFITLGVTLFAWWNSYDLLNTLGTVAVVIGISLLPAVFLFLLVFWIKMLIDSARQKRWVWFVVILLGDVFFAYIYLLVKKPRLSWKSFRAVSWISLALFVLMWIVQIYAGIFSLIDPIDLSKLEPTGRQFEAKIVTKDLVGYQYDGKTVCREMKIEEDNQYFLEVSGGTVSASSDEPLKLNYRLSAVSDLRTEISGGWQHVQESEPTKTQYIEVAELVGGPSEVDSGLTGCELELWSSN
ncbi:MAG TPA: hypothetical protein PKB09_03930 [Candidatus Saccharibacteria bacterium]|nr:hypothetical protein [Candidatus Saccharibacteria bacterium]